MRASKGVSTRDQRGAAAVEFALVLPVLLLLVMGIIDFGYAFFVHGTAAGAAREGVRDFAIHNNVGQAQAKAASYLPASVAVVGIAVSPGSCSPGVDATVSVRYQAETLSGFFETLFSGVVLEGRAVMRCGG